MINKKTNNNEDVPTIRVAEYVRMSTDHQQYSTENQADVIHKYAEAHNMPKRLDVRRAAERWSRRLPGVIEQKMKR